jgi:hypothetical protein
MGNRASDQAAENARRAAEQSRQRIQDTANRNLAETIRWFQRTAKASNKRANEMRARSNAGESRPPKVIHFVVFALIMLAAANMLGFF